VAAMAVGGGVVFLEVGVLDALERKFESILEF